MVTELTLNLLQLLRSSSTIDNELGLIAMGYGETEEDYEKLSLLLAPYDLDTYLLGPIENTMRYSIEKIVILKRRIYRTDINGKDNTKST
jgi:hypothetical protein